MLVARDVPKSLVRELCTKRRVRGSHSLLSRGLCRRVVKTQHLGCVSSPYMPNPPIQTDDLDFELPKELIATSPAEPRDSSRLLVVQRSDPGRLEHRVFSDLPSLLSAEDLLVFNRSRVVPARLIGENAANTGGKFEGLYLHSIEPIDGHQAWIVLLKAKRTKPGKRYRLTDANGHSTEIVIELIEKHEPEGPGAWKVLVHNPDLSQTTERILEQVGHTPLPPYIVAQRKIRGEDPGDAYDRSHYQTVYASQVESGSVAAPTAGLHFTPEVFNNLAARSVQTSEVSDNAVYAVLAQYWCRCSLADFRELGWGHLNSTVPRPPPLIGQERVLR